MVSEAYSLDNSKGKKVPKSKSKKKAYIEFGKQIFDLCLAVIIFLLFITNVAQNYLNSIFSGQDHWFWASFNIALVLLIINTPAAVLYGLLSKKVEMKDLVFAIFGVLFSFLGIFIFFFCLSAFFLLSVKLFQTNWWLPVFAINLGFSVLTSKLIKSTFIKKDIIEKSKINSVLDKIFQKTSFYFENVYETEISELTLAVQGKSLIVNQKLSEHFSDDELEVMIMHEISHVKKKDQIIRLILTLTLTAASWIFILWTVNSIFNVSWEYSTALVIWVPLILAAYKIINFIIKQIVNAVSRMHEYRADKFAVKNASNPSACISGLNKTHQYACDNSLDMKTNSALFVLTDHPSTEKRIRRMEKMLNQ